MVVIGKVWAMDITYRSDGSAFTREQTASPSAWTVKGLRYNVFIGRL